MRMMMWQYEENGKDPFEYYKNKYGNPNVYAIGNGVTISPPNGVQKLDIRVPNGQVWIGYAEGKVEVIEL